LLCKLFEIIIIDLPALRKFCLWSRPVTLYIKQLAFCNAGRRAFIYNNTSIEKKRFDNFQRLLNNQVSMFSPLQAGAIIPLNGSGMLNGSVYVIEG
jgi:hypothetical protein